MNAIQILLRTLVAVTIMVQTFSITAVAQAAGAKQNHQEPPSESATSTSKTPASANDTKLDTTKVQWLSDFRSAKKLAKKEQKFLLVEAGAQWCPDCRRLDSSIIPDEKVQTYLSAHFVCAKLDSDSGEGKQLQAKHHTTVIPTLYVYSREGKFLHKAAAEHVTPDSFITLLTQLSS